MTNDVNHNVGYQNVIEELGQFCFGKFYSEEQCDDCEKYGFSKCLNIQLMNTVFHKPC